MHLPKESMSTKTNGARIPSISATQFHTIRYNFVTRNIIPDQKPKLMELCNRRKQISHLFGQIAIFG
jgi:hypothetical protein